MLPLHALRALRNHPQLLLGQEPQPQQHDHAGAFASWPAQDSQAELHLAYVRRTFLARLPSPAQSQVPEVPELPVSELLRQRWVWPAGTSLNPPKPSPVASLAQLAQEPSAALPSFFPTLPFEHPVNQQLFVDFLCHLCIPVSFLM